MLSIFGRRYRYVVAEDGMPPVWEEVHTARFHNPVSVGDQIKPRRAGEGLRKVVRVVHYLEGSVLFTVSARSQQDKSEGGRMSKWDLAQLPDAERKQVDMDKAAAAVAYPERTGKPVVPEMEMRQFPPGQWPEFIARQEYYRRVCAALPPGSDPVYQKPDEKPATGQ